MKGYVLGCGGKLRVWFIVCVVGINRVNISAMWKVAILEVILLGSCVILSYL
jgi:hypothetical protein